MNKIMVSASDLSLFHVAARELGNPMQWWQIAQLNGLSDWDLTSLGAPLAILLPYADLNIVDGVPQQ